MIMLVGIVVVIAAVLLNNGGFSEAINDLRVARKAAKNDPDPLSSARGFHDVVIPIMDRLRMAADHAEQVCGEDFWPLPTYSKMLYYVED